MSLQSELRIYIWLILLNSPPMPTRTYLDLVGQGASPAYAKIRDDTFRTLTTDPLFRRRVSENSLTRVLNAIAWKLHDANEAKINGWQSPPTLGVPRSIDGGSDIFHSPASVTSGDHTLNNLRHGSIGENASEAGTDAEPPASSGGGVGYVQGMNVMAAPFLYAAKSEAEAFAAFSAYITTSCPGYVRASMDGVHAGLALVDTILQIVDPKLAMHLSSNGMNAKIYAFASVLTLCACTPPLPEVLRLWDVLFAYGPHLNLVAIVAQVILQKEKLMESSSPKPNFQPLDAQKVIALTVSLARKLPEDVYERMLSHAK